MPEPPAVPEHLEASVPVPELPTFSVDAPPLPLLVMDPQELEGEAGSGSFAVLAPLELPSSASPQLATPFALPEPAVASPAAAAAQAEQTETAPAQPGAPSTAAQFVHRGTIAALARAEDLLESSKEPPLSTGPSLPVFRLVLAASRIGAAVTISLGEWQIELSRSGHLLSLTAPGNDSVLQHMMRNRLLQRSVGERALEAAREEGVPPEQFLMARGEVTAATMAKGLQGFAVARSNDLVSLADCPYMVRSGLKGRPQLTTYSDRFLRELVKQSVRLLSPDALDAFFRERSALGLAVATDAMQRIENLAQQPSEQRWLARQDGTLSLEESLHQCPIARPTALELVFALLAMGLAQLGPVAGDVVTESSPEQTLLEWQREIEGRRHFEALRLHWTAHCDEIDARICQVRQRLSPEGALAQSSAQTAELAAAILRQSEAAYEALAAPEQRARIRRESAGTSDVNSARYIMQKQISSALMRGDKRTATRLSDVLKELLG
jgi:hypothetical protein